MTNQIIRKLIREALIDESWFDDEDNLIHLFKGRYTIYSNATKIINLHLENEVLSDAVKLKKIRKTLMKIEPQINHLDDKVDYPSSHF